MVGLLALLILLLTVYAINLSAKISRDWLTSPAVMMMLFFVAVMLPGLLLEADRDLALIALLGYALWVSGALCAIFFSGIMVQSTPREDIFNGAGEAGRLAGNYQVFMLFVLLAVPAVIFTFSMLGRIPLFIGLGSILGDASDLTMHQARRMNTLEHRSGDTVYFGQGYLRQIYTVVSPVFLVAASIVMAGGRSRKALRFLFFMKIFLVVAAALNGQIWISVTVLLLFGMGRIVMLGRNGGRRVDSFKLIRKGAWIYAGLLCFVFVYRYFQFLQGRQFDNFFVDTLKRIYLPGAIDLFTIFPERESFRFGSTWLNDLAGMLPGSTQSFAYEVHYLVNGGAWGFTLSPGIVPSAYVNFGFVGVFVTAFVFTMLFNLLYYRLVASSSAIRIAIGIYLSQMFTLAMPGDIGSYVVPLVTAVLIFWAYVFCNSFYNQMLAGQRKRAIGSA